MVQHWFKTLRSMLPIPNSVTNVNLSDMCLVGLQEWTMKDMCLKEVRLHAINVITILDSVTNILGGTYTTSS